MFRWLFAVLLLLLSFPVMAQETETPFPTLPPTFTPTPTITLTPTPDVMIYSTVLPAGESTGQAVVFEYRITAGDVILSALVFALLCLSGVHLIVLLWRR